MTQIEDDYVEEEYIDFQKLRPFTDRQYLERALSSYNIAEDLFKSAECWPKTMGFWMADEIRSMQHPRYGKLLYLKQFIEAEVEHVFDILWTKMDKTSDWNIYIKSINTVHKIDDFTDVIYTVSVPILGGLISPRDFLDVRYFQRHDDGRVTGSFVSIPSDVIPLRTDLVRGINGPNYWSNSPFVRKKDGKKGTLMEWIFNTDVRGDIPRSIGQKAQSIFLSFFARSIKIQAEKMEK